MDLQEGVLEPLEALSPPETAGKAEKSVLVPAQSATNQDMGREGRLPPLHILMQEQSSKPDEGNIHVIASGIERTLLEFGIPARVVGYRIGPTVTQYAVEPGFIEKPGPDGIPIRQKIRVSQISNLQRDLALALSAEKSASKHRYPGNRLLGSKSPMNGFPL